MIKAGCSQGVLSTSASLNFSYAKLSEKEKKKIIKSLVEGDAAVVVTPNSEYDARVLGKIFKSVYICASYAEAKSVREDFLKAVEG